MRLVLQIFLLSWAVACNAAVAQTFDFFGGGMAVASQASPAAGGGGGSVPPAIQQVVTNYIVVGSGNRTNTMNIPAAAADRLLIVQIGMGNGTWALPTTLTCDGTDILANRLWNTNDANWVASQAFYMIAPPTGAAVKVVWNGGVDEPDQLAFVTMLITNAHQSAPFGTAVSLSGTATTATATVSSAVGELVLAAIATDSQNTLAVAGGGSLIWRVQGLDSDTDHGGATYSGASPTVAASWTKGASEPGWALGAVSIKAP